MTAGVCFRLPCHRPGGVLLQFVEGNQKVYSEGTRIAGVDNG